MPKVSVIIPIYNAQATVSEALDSVLAQTYTDYEMIVVNDGSTDNSEGIIRRYLTAGMGDITCVTQRNKGAAAARNAGIRIARGELIAFLDADDLWDKDKLKTSVETLDAHPGVMLAFSDMRHHVDGEAVHASYLHERGYRHVASGQIYDNLLKENFIFTPTVVMRKSIFAKAGYFDESLKIAEDYDLWLRITKDSEVLFIDRPLVTRRRTGSNITQDKQLYIESAIRLREKLLQTHAQEPQRRAIIEEQLRRDRYQLGYALFDTMRLKESRKAFSKTLFDPQYFLKSLFYIIVSFLPVSAIRSLRKIRAGKREKRKKTTLT